MLVTDNVSVGCLLVSMRGGHCRYCDLSRGWILTVHFHKPGQSQLQMDSWRQGTVTHQLRSSPLQPDAAPFESQICPHAIHFPFTSEALGYIIIEIHTLFSLTHGS